MSIKSADALMSDLLRAAKPPINVDVQISEISSDTADVPNWVASIDLEALPYDAATRFDGAVRELARQTPRVDWNDVPIAADSRRTVVACLF